MRHFKFPFIILAALLNSGCEKESPEAITTTLKVVNNTTRVHYDEEPLLTGSLYEVILFAFIENDLSGEISMEDVHPEGGESEIIEISNEVTKVKLSFTLLPPQSDYFPEIDRSYTASYKFINQGELNEITIHDNTMLQTWLKKSSSEISLKKKIEYIQE